MATKINLHKPISNSDKIIESAIVSEETKKSNVKKRLVKVSQNERQVKSHSFGPMNI